MKSFFQAGLMVCLLHTSQLLAADDCGEAQASSIWMATEERLASLFDIKVSTPPKFVIYKTAQDLPKQSGDMVIGYYDHDSKEISVACYDGDTSVFAQNVRHESTHYYLQMAFGNPPGWLDEGLAAYMETGAMGEGTPEQHLNKKRLDEFVHLLRKARVPPLVSILEGDGFSRPSQFYAASWALVFSLLHHDNQKIQTARRDQVRKLLQRVKAGESNPAVINREFVSYVLQETHSVSSWQTKWHRQIWSLP